MEIFLHNVWSVVNELAPWLLVGCLAAGVMHVFLPGDFLSRHLGGKGVLSVLKAVLLGVPMPLCSCGVIPAAIALKKKGAGDGASLGFLISTPQTGVDSILVSAAFLSWPFALFKLLSAFILGLLGGLIANCVSKDLDRPIVKEALGNEKRGFGDVYDFAVNDLLYMIWRWLVVGILVSAAISTWLPEDLVGSWRDIPLLYSLLLVLLISIPLYVCATSSVPIAAALVHAGMPPSAALVFLMAGPATNMATIGAVYRAFGSKQLIVYLMTIILGSIGLALSFDFVLQVEEAAHSHEHGIGTSIFSYVLLLLFVVFVKRDVTAFLLREELTVSDDPQFLEFEVDGLTCQGCVRKLTASLNGLKGVIVIGVSIEDGVVSLQGEPLNHLKISQAVEKSGFRLRKALC